MTEVIRKGEMFPKGWFRLFDIDSPCRESGLVIRIPLWWEITRDDLWRDAVITGPAELTLAWITRFGPCAHPGGMPRQDFYARLWPRKITREVTGQDLMEAAP